jgi:tetratricopeptide (TPR) repeat protein
MTSLANSAEKRTNSFRTIFSAALFIGLATKLKTASLLLIKVLSIFKFGWVVPTLGTMVLSLVLYGFKFGWSFAALLVSLLLIHELGHWVWMKVNDLNPRAPMFVPFLGAFVAMRKMPADEATHAWTAFAGPFIGGIGALIFYLAGMFAHQEVLIAGGSFGITLNLLQLLPAKPLDGGYIVGAISKWLLVPGTLALFYLAASWHSPLLVFTAVLSVLSFIKPPKGKRGYSGSAKTVAELERQFVVLSNSEKPIKFSETNPFEQERAKPIQRLQIGAAYLCLVISLGVLGTATSPHIELPDKTFAGTQAEVVTRCLAWRDDGNLRLFRSKLYASQNRLAEAEVDAQKAIDLGFQNYDGYFNLGRYRLLAGQRDQKTADAFERAENASAPRSVEAWCAAYGLLLCGDYNRALQASSRLGDKLDVKAEVLERTGHQEEARVFYDEAISKQPDYMWGPRWRRALYLISNHLPELARPDLDTALKLADDEAAVHLIQGWYLCEVGRLDDAWTQSEKVLTQLAANYDFIDKNDVLAACHRLRAEICIRRERSTPYLAETQRIKRQQDLETAEYGKLRDFGTLYIPRNIQPI